MAIASASGEQEKVAGYATQIAEIDRSLDRVWAKYKATYLTPEEVARAAQRAGLRVELTRGLFYDPLSAAWSLCKSTQVNFALVARRDGAA
jgi:2-polyprenyl-3-methyl-5-hydroxy-6-metoxy-1,4-benzoquinol methylase